ncbi:hypothetical protein BDW22DRAFT_1477760 [Trametopsis cervina]|nr:hypothetical protein BDW22DRAFT_1477760 [Trametopsis cervina]
MLRLPPSSVRFFSSSSFHRLPRISSDAFARIPSFRDRVARSKPLKSFQSSIQRPGIRNQILFATFGSLAAFVYAADYTNKDTEKWAAVAREKGKIVFKLTEPTSNDMRAAKRFQLGRDVQAGYDSLMDTLQSWPNQLKTTASWLYIQIMQPVLDAEEGRVMAWGLVGLCASTWLMWRAPRMQSFMTKHFAHDPLSGRSYTLLTSMFSHAGFFHLAINCFVLTGTGTTVWFALRNAKGNLEKRTGMGEADSRWHALAFFISAGLFAGLVSHVAKSTWVFSRIISRASAAVRAASKRASGETPAAPRKFGWTINPSVGISGAVYAGLTLTAMAAPYAQVALIFLPMVPIPIQWGVGAAVLFDIIGVIRGPFSGIDHFAHLGGALFGVLYWSYGPVWWEWLRYVLGKHEEKQRS